MNNKVYYEVIIEMRDGGWGDCDVWYDRLLLEQETTLQGMFTMVGEGKVVAIEVTTDIPNDLPI